MYVDLPKKFYYEKVLFSTQLSHHLMRKLLKNSLMVSSVHTYIHLLILYWRKYAHVEDRYVPIFCFGCILHSFIYVFSTVMVERKNVIVERWYWRGWVWFKKSWQEGRTRCLYTLFCLERDTFYHHSAVDSFLNQGVFIVIAKLW